MTYFGMLGFLFGLIAFAEVYTLKKRVAALEAQLGGKVS